MKDVTKQKIWNGLEWTGENILKPMAFAFGAGLGRGLAIRYTTPPTPPPDNIRLFKNLGELCEYIQNTPN